MLTSETLSVIIYTHVYGVRVAGMMYNGNVWCSRVKKTSEALLV